MKLTPLILASLLAAHAFAASAHNVTTQANPDRPIVPATALAASEVCTACPPSPADLKRYSASPVPLPNPDTLPK